MIGQEALRELEAKFAGRVTRDPLECRLYSHDVGVMPPLVRPLLGLHAAEAVVQPRSEEELIWLAQWANRHRVPLTPRGKGTSGYGGAVPLRGGVVVDFYRLRRTVSLDKEAMTATVRAGAIFEEVEKAANREGLALRLYPSSAPSATVGGWLAQGGFGYGSFEFGPFRDNVLSARVVLPSGQVREFSGEELELVADAEGTTGLISTITIKLRPLERELVLAAAFGERSQAISALEAIVRQGLPLWSLTLANAALNSLRNRMPPKLEHGRAHERHRAPEGYVLLAAFPESRSGACLEPLRAIVTDARGRLLSEEEAQAEWAERFHIMAVKRLGPSLIPFEVCLPLSGLLPALAEVEDGLKLPVAAEVMVASGLTQPQAVILGFMLHDERKLGYNFAFAGSLSALQTAKKHGGRAYSTGLYFAHEAAAVLGEARLQRLRAFKASVDPQGILNPGKVLDGPAVFAGFMRAAGTLGPALRAVANAFPSPAGERFAPKKGIPGDIAWYAYACAQCGYCVDTCDEFYGRGWESHSPRGKWYFLRQVMEGRAKITQEWVDKFLICTTCEYCNVRCPVELPIEPAWLTMRGKLIQEEKRQTFPPFEMMAASLRKERNIWAAFAKDRDAWLPAELKAALPERAEIAYFAGCTASYVEPDIARGTVALLREAGVQFTYLGPEEACCGIPMLVAGKWDVFAEILRHNVQAMQERGVHTVVTSCPACWLSWAQYYPQWAGKLGLDYRIEAKHYSQLLAEAIDAGKVQFKQEVPLTVAYHDPCHMGRAGGIYEEPRRVLQAIPGIRLVEMEHNREQAHCCGSVLTLIGEPPVAKVIGDIRLQEAEAAGAQAVVASCPCCEFQFRVTAARTGRNLPVYDLGALAARSLGISLPDHTEQVLYMWSVFEAMIELMTPQGMAALMRSLLPEMFAAMPGYMLAMMRLGKRLPGMLALMGKAMPRMMPLLMPTVMPKVLPSMLERIGSQINMPESMRAQMPALMPAVMENLMPHMLPKVAPLLVPDMLAYIERSL